MRVSTKAATVNPAGSPKITDTTPRETHDEMPFESFEDLTTKLLKVPKEEVSKRRIEWKEARKHKQD
jgi:hypothetical protein